MPIESFNREKIGSHLNHGDKRLKFGAKSSKKEGDLFLFNKRFINGNKCGNKASKLVKIISYRIISLLQSGELIVNIHNASPRMGSEHPFESEPDLSRCCAFDNIGEYIFGQGRDQSTKDHLILNKLGLIIVIGLRR